MRFWVLKNEAFLKGLADGEKSVKNMESRQNPARLRFRYLQMLQNIDYTKLIFLTTTANNDVN